MSIKHKIAVLEDNELIADFIAVALQQAGWEFSLYGTIADISQALHSEQFDLLLLDWSVPDGEADQVIRLVRETLKLSLPIMIESINGDESQVVEALQIGADDYVIKPLRMPELLARIQALLRRSAPAFEHPAAVTSRTYGDIHIEPEQHRVSLNQNDVELTAKEYDLLVYMLDHANELLSRDTLLSKIWGLNVGIESRTVDTHVSHIRNKLKLNQNSEIKITSLRGFGYRLEFSE